MMCGTSYKAMNQSGYCFRSIHLPSLHSKIVEQLPLHAQFHGGTTIMRREVIDFIQPFYRTYSFESDADLCCRILSRFKASNVVEPLYYYRILPTSMSRTNVDAVFLNSYRIVFWLYQQRAKMGKDVLEKGNFIEIEQYVEDIRKNYSVVSLCRQCAFRDFYWGLSGPAIRWSWKAIRSDYTDLKSYAVFTFICFRSVFSLVKVLFTNKHYSVFIKKS